MTRCVRIFAPIVVLLGTISVSVASGANSPAALALQQEYSNYVVRGATNNLECTSKVSQGNEFVLCTYGEGRWPHKGLWIVDGPDYYALNGKALSALEKLRHSSNFSNVPTRMKVDTPSVMAIFEGSEPGGRLVEIIPEETVSQNEIDTFCAYEDELYSLSIQANARFGEDNSLSEDRAAWLEAKILKLQQRYFTDQGMDYYAVSGKVTSTGIRCPR